MTHRYFIYFAYNGGAYHGWQVQPNGVSVQEVLEKSLSVALQAEISVVGAGRTDSGVHAKLMVAHFDSENETVCSPEFLRKLNNILPIDIEAKKIVNVQPDAHARFDALSRKYEYHVVTNKNVFLNGLAVKMLYPLNFEEMNKAAALLKNYTDFTSFSKLHTDVKTNNCEIFQAQWESKNGVWIFTIEANRFLRNMVRAIVGTLFEVGRNKMTLQQFCDVIEAKNRSSAGASVPAKGLYLVDVSYPDTVFINKK